MKVPIETEGIRLDTVLRDIDGNFVYQYTQSLRTRPKLRKVDIVLSGDIWEGDSRLYEMPRSEPLTFYISSLSSFVDGTERYLSRVIERRAFAHTACYVEFEKGRSEVDLSLGNNREEMGRIRDNIQIKPNAYIIKLKGIEIAKGELLLDHYLAMNSGTVFEEVPGIETTEPAFGLPALWIPETEREQAELNGYTVVDAVSVLATHLTEVIKAHADEILGRQETQNLIDNLKKTNESLVDEVVPDLMNVGEIQKVLANLLKERITIRDMSTILEVLADYARATKDTEILTEYVRHAMARQITLQNVQNNILSCVTLDPSLENRIAGGVQRTDHGSYVSLDPDSMQRLISALNTELSKLTNMGYQPIVLTSPAVRLYFRKLVERSVPGITVLSHAEIEQSVEIQILGVVKI